MPGNSLAVQWLGLGSFMSGAWVQSRVRELRYCKRVDTVKKKKKEQKRTSVYIILVFSVLAAPLKQDSF